MNDTYLGGPVVECRALTRSFTDAGHRVTVLRGVNLAVARGERVAIVGTSGAGKSSLLHLMGGLDTPTSGQVRVAGQDISRLSGGERGRLRNRSLGFVYQFHHLLPEFSVVENVAMPLLVRREGVHRARQKATTLLERVGLTSRLDHKPGEISGGERQRVAIARALVNDPLCVLADEPTGNLDPATADSVYQLMMRLNRDLGTSIVTVTHDMDLARRMDRVLRMSGGYLEELSPDDVRAGSAAG